MPVHSAICTIDIYLATLQVHIDINLANTEQMLVLIQLSSYYIESYETIQNLHANIEGFC